MAQTTAQRQPTATAQDNPLLAAAWDYAKRGLPVFPCRRADKSPLVAHGFKDATKDPQQIGEWWHRWPDAMIGMPSGSASGIDVIDIDCKPGEDIDGHKFLPDWATMSSVIVETPSGGHHLYFQSNDKVRCTTDVIAPGVDTRAEGGYVIVPPSGNALGRYRFVAGDKRQLSDLTTLPPLPADLVSKLGARYAGWGGDTPTADPERIAAAMAVIPNPDLGWDDWKKFGMAIWRATGGSAEGFTIFNEWSQKSVAKYDATLTKKAWDQITRSPPTRIGAGTIFHFANKADPSWGTRGALVLPIGAPLDAAEAFLKRCCSDGEVPLLWSYRGAFYRWTGKHYREYADEILERDLYAFLKPALALSRDGRCLPFNPNKNKVLEIVHALRRACLISRDCDTPCWLDTGEFAGDLVACHNGILNLKTRHLQPHDPLFFTTNCLPLNYDPVAPKPKRWLKFLEEIWPADKEGYYDSEAEETLQEIAGYLLTPDTRQQKIFLVIGPPRSGKGTIVHVLVQLLGDDNCVFPTLSSLSGEFGRWPLIDKKLAAITDARISSKADTHKVAELLLSISGGDRQTINRKNQAFWTGRLDVRFLITTNVLPAIRDASGTIATRYVVLKLTESFLGREDLNLKVDLAPEMAGILNWALDGLNRLRKCGHFRIPSSSKESIRELEDAAEPVRAFLREWCKRGPDQRVNVKTFYRNYRAWADETGQPMMAKNSFGRALRGQLPKLKTTGAGAKRDYVGVALSSDGQDQFDALMQEKGQRH
jgi:putative DNA primase/helicase